MELARPKGASGLMLGYTEENSIGGIMPQDTATNYLDILKHVNSEIEHLRDAQ